MNIESLKVGDKITVRGSDRSPPSVRTLTKVTKTSVTDDKGDRWTMGGRLWGEKGSWHFTLCEPWKPEHDQQIADCKKEFEEKKRRNIVMHFNYSRLDQDTIDKVYAVLDEYAKRQVS